MFGDTVETVPMIRCLIGALSAMREQGCNLQELSNRTGMTPAELRAFLLRRLSIFPEEASKIAAALNLHPARVTSLGEISTTEFLEILG